MLGWTRRSITSLILKESQEKQRRSTTTDPTLSWSCLHVAVARSAILMFFLSTIFLLKNSCNFADIHPTSLHMRLFRKWQLCVLYLILISPSIYHFLYRLLYILQYIHGPHFRCTTKCRSELENLIRSLRSNFWCTAYVATCRERASVQLPSSALLCSTGAYFNQGVSG